MRNQKLTQYPTWRLWPVHAVARLFGVLVKVDGYPFGSNRLYRPVSETQGCGLDNQCSTSASSTEAIPEVAMSEAIKAGDIPHDIQRDVILQAVLAAVDVARLTADGDPGKAARAVAEAGVLAWQLLNGASPSEALSEAGRVR